MMLQKLDAWKPKGGAQSKQRSHSRQREQEKESVKAFQDLHSIVEEISKITTVGNMWDPKYGATPALVWEYFATAFLPHCWGRDDLYAEHIGGPNDMGADVLLYRKPKQLKAVVQVKRGQYFEEGKGNSIVLGLVGSCVYYGVRRGIVVSNEVYEKLKDKKRENLKELIEEFEHRGYEIKCFFRCEIQNIVDKPSTRRKRKILMHFEELLRGN